MGNQQTKTASILVQDDEFDDIFAKYWLNKSFPSTNWIEYIVGDYEKFEGDSLNAKNILTRAMGFDLLSVPRLYTNGDGTINRDTYDFVSFVESVREDLSPYHDTDGFNIQIILTGQCASFVGIISDCLNETNTSLPYLTPTKVEIIVVNGKHNGKNLFAELLKLTDVCTQHNIDLIIREFNAFSSMGNGSDPWVELAVRKSFVECCTSDTFNKNVINSAQSGNEIAKSVIQYGVTFNSSIVANVELNIADAVRTLFEINPTEAASWDLHTLFVGSYIDDLIYEEDGVYELDVEICQQLSKDLRVIVQCTNAELKHVDEDLASGTITKDQSSKFKKDLYHILGWFSVKAEITSCNMIQFPIHDMASVIMATEGDSLTPINGWAIKFGEFMSIVKDKPNDINTFPVIHYVANDPESTRQIIEDMIFKAIEESA